MASAQNLLAQDFQRGVARRGQVCGGERGGEDVGGEGGGEEVEEEQRARARASNSSSTAQRLAQRARQQADAEVEAEAGRADGQKKEARVEVRRGGGGGCAGRRAGGQQEPVSLPRRRAAPWRGPGRCRSWSARGRTPARRGLGRGRQLGRGLFSGGRGLHCGQVGRGRHGGAESPAGADARSLGQVTQDGRIGTFCGRTGALLLSPGRWPMPPPSALR